MFGLMKVPSCMGKEFIDSSKLHYCGVCKSIASDYSQKSRLLLNYDTVFLSEVLSALSKENTVEWNNIYSIKKCLILPSNRLPIPLQFAGATNVFLSELKLNDNLFDSKNLKYFWFIIKKSFKSDFKKAIDNLSKWGLDVTLFYHLCQEHNKREKSKNNFDSPHLSLDYISEKTSEMTSIIFKTSTKVIKKEKEFNTMGNIGYLFGRIIYTLDAIKDFEKDYKYNNFNAIKYSYNYNDNILNEEIKLDLSNYISESYFGLSKEISKLDLSLKIRKFFIKRLHHNINNQLKELSLSQIFDSSNDIYSIDINKKNQKTQSSEKKKKENSLCAFDLSWCECCQCCECIECFESCGESSECCCACGECSCS